MRPVISDVYDPLGRVGHTGFRPGILHFESGKCRFDPGAAGMRPAVESRLKGNRTRGRNAPNLSADEAAKNGLTERDPNWPWHNLHETEEHHPLMQGDEYRQFWKDRGFTDDFVQNWTETWDKDVHQAAKDWWSENLTNNILEKEAAQGGQLLTPEQVLDEAFKLLDRMSEFSP